MSEEKKLAVLIDSDNVSAKYAQFVMNEVQKYGVPTYKRVYGDWEKGGNGWHAPAVNYSIMPVQQTSYVAGKNATDFSMIIDAMDILYTGNVDGFVLVTSDSDFTRLAIRLRESGKLVVGIGELKTPRPFTVSCHHFCYLNQIGEMETTYDEPAIRKAVLNFVTENKDERLDLARISAVLTSKFGNINFDELGYKRFSNFIDSFPELRRNNTFVSLRKKRQEQPAPARAAEEATEQSISAAMQDYFSEHEPENDNMLKIESYLNNRFGKIDFAKFGSARFARFIDKLPQFTRTGTRVKPAQQSAQAASAPAQEAKLDTAAYRSEVMTYAGDNMPDGGNIGQLNNRLMNAFGKDYFRALGFSDFKSALGSVTEVRVDGNKVFLAGQAEQVPVIQAKPAGMPGPDEKAVFARIQSYAAENMPDGGNLGQLNNELMTAYGRDYIDAMGYGDFRALLSSVPDIRISKNRAFSLKPLVVEPAPEPAKPMEDTRAAAENVAKVIAEVNAPAEAVEKTEPVQPVPETTGSSDAGNEEKSEITETAANPEKNGKPGRNRKVRPAAAAESVHPEEPTVSAGQTEPSEPEQTVSGSESAEKTGSQEKPELNAVKREVLQFVAGSENGASLSGLGGDLSEKYGKDFLKELGLSSMRKLAAEISGIVVKNNKLYISDEFAKQTEEIERFVNEFARAEGSHSIRALGIQLKEKFEGFDFRNYGFARFTDFINAIDGVKADRYHVRAVEQG